MTTTQSEPVVLLSRYQLAALIRYGRIVALTDGGKRVTLTVELDADHSVSP